MCAVCCMLPILFLAIHFNFICEHDEVSTTLLFFLCHCHFSRMFKHNIFASQLHKYTNKAADEHFCAFVLCRQSYGFVLNYGISLFLYAQFNIDIK